MRKNFFLVSIIVFLTLSMSVMILLVVRANYKSHLKNNKIEIMPDFSLSSNKIYLNSESLKGEKSLFIYFNSECSFCQIEIEKLYSMIDCFNNIRTIMVTSEDIDLVERKPLIHQLLLNSEFEIYHDKDNSFKHSFNITVMPTTFYYDEKQKLVFKSDGIDNLDELFNLLTE